MKNTSLTILAIFFSLVAFAQTTIKNPKQGFYTDPRVILEKVEITDTTTVLSFHYKSRPKSSISIPKKTYIQSVESDKKMYIKRTEGIPMGERYKIPKSGEVRYKLVFPPIDKSVSKIDYREENGTWSIFDIQINKSVKPSLIPEKLTGNWFNKEDGNWEISLFDTLAVYQGKIWSYENVKLKKGKGSIQLKHGQKNIQLFIKSHKKGDCLIGESPKKQNTLTRYTSDLSIKAPADDKPYETPIFNIDTATYTGYIKDYTPRIGVKTMSISIDDIITGEHPSHLIEISENGFFSVKLPIYNPSYAFVRSELYNGTVYLEPGKELFQLIGYKNEYSSTFMGEPAKINTDLIRLRKIDEFNYRKMQRKILDMNPEEYKAYCRKSMDKAQTKLDSIMQTGTISAKSYQVVKLDLKYSCAERMMFYKHYFQSAYRKKHKIPRSQRTIPVKIDTLTAEYFDFITEDMANNPLGVLCSSYSTFINRLKYLDILRAGSSSFSLTTSNIIDELKKSGYTFTDEDKKVIEILNEQEALTNQPEIKEFNKKFIPQRIEFFKKHQSKINELRKKLKNSDFSFEKVKTYFTEEGINLTEAEKDFLEAQIAHNKSETVLKVRQIYNNNRESIDKFHQKHRGFVDNLFTQKGIATRNENLQNKLGVKPGFATDIMTAQDECRKIVAEMTPDSNEGVKKIQQLISTPFIADYIAICNDRSKVKIQENKLKTGYVVNRTPKTEGDKLFDAIMEKYRGKVVYVDFWATWCGPCRSGIERVKPLKEELKDQDVAFVYITNNTSPQKTWSNMIANIKGEHYRVSSDEWNYLKSKFNITGIPHYVLVGKDGKVISPKLGHLSNNLLKRKLEKHLAN